MPRSEPVLPFAPFAALIAEIIQDFVADFDFEIEPRAVQIIYQKLERYMVDLLERANLFAIHARRNAVYTKDLQRSGAGVERRSLGSSCKWAAALRARGSLRGPPVARRIGQCW